MRLNKRVFDNLDITECFIAGGAILSLVTKSEINDYDIYPKNFDGFKSAISFFKRNSFSIANISEKAITLTGWLDKTFYVVQVMLFDWSETVDTIFNNFDFTVCMAAYDFDNEKFIFHNEFYPDIASKTLRFNNNTKYPLASLMRVQKYNKKGFNIGRFEYAKIALALSKKGLPNSWAELESQLGGIYGKQIALECKDIEYTYDNAITILSNMDLNFEEYLKDNSDEFSSISEKMIFNCFNNDHSEYIQLNDNKCCFVNDYFVNGAFSKKVFDITSMPKNVKKVTNRKLYGYSYSDVSSYYNSSNIYASKKGADNNKKIRLVTFNSDDINDIDTYTSRLLFKKTPNSIKEVPFDTTQEDDIINYISETILT